MAKFIVDNIDGLIELRKGDPERLHRIKQTFENDKINSMNDRIYLDKLITKYLPDEESIKQENYGIMSEENIQSQDSDEFSNIETKDVIQEKFHENDKVELEKQNIQPEQSYKLPSTKLEILEKEKEQKSSTALPVKKILIGAIAAIIVIAVGYGISVSNLEIPTGNTIESPITQNVVVGLAGSSSSDLKLFIDESSYNKADIISISGKTDPMIDDSVILSIQNEQGNLIWQENLTPKNNGEFSTLLIAGGQGWENVGKYTLKSEHGDMENNLDFDFNN